METVVVVEVRARKRMETRSYRYLAHVAVAATSSARPQLTAPAAADRAHLVLELHQDFLLSVHLMKSASLRHFTPGSVL